jgi:hypothetical protein
VKNFSVKESAYSLYLCNKHVYCFYLIGVCVCMNFFTGFLLNFITKKNYKSNNFRHFNFHTNIILFLGFWISKEKLVNTKDKTKYGCESIVWEQQRHRLFCKVNQLVLSRWCRSFRKLLQVLRQIGFSIFFLLYQQTSSISFILFEVYLKANCPNTYQWSIPLFVTRASLAG